MTPGLQVALRRLEGQWRNLFRRIRTGFVDQPRLHSVARQSRLEAAPTTLVSDVKIFRSAVA